jgi:fructose-bisphosphate aldolase, class I
MEKLTPSNKYKDELIANALKIVTPGKGILAADESTGTIGKRFDKINVENIEEHRREYRELLFTTEGLENYISGVILFKETLTHKTKDGVPLVKVLLDKGIIPGIKVDAGTVEIPGTDKETATQGLDDLGKLCANYYSQGCRFAKWRAVLKIGKDLPSRKAVLENAHGLARYASICQQNGLVPIVEPEVLVDGAHSIDECAEKSEEVFHYVVRALKEFDVLFEGMLLKPNMITPGTDFPDREKVTADEIAWKTVRTLLRTLPGAVPGVTFLSGGQSEEEATENLNAMNLLPERKRPWALSFSFGRALQHSCLTVWQGKKENFKAAQDALLAKAKANSEASVGAYKSSGTKGESLYVKNYVY